MKTCPVCKNSFEPSKQFDIFCGGGHCLNADKVSNASKSTSPKVNDDVGAKHLFATQSIATILIYFIWSFITFGIGFAFAYIPVLAYDGYGSEPEPMAGWIYFGVFSSAILQIYGLIKASTDLKKSRM